MSRNATRVLLALAAFGFVLGACPSTLRAQASKPPQVRSEVQVGPKAPPAGAPAPAAAPAASPAPEQTMFGPPAKRTLRRNPFVPPILHGAAPAVAKPETGHAPGPTGKPGKPTEEKAPEAAPVTAPSFALVGILTSHGRVHALVVTAKGERVIGVGSVVEGYTVRRIDVKSRQVLVEMDKHPFRVGIPRETPYGTSGTHGSTGGTPPPARGSAPAGGAPAPSGNGPAPLQPPPVPTSR